MSTPTLSDKPPRTAQARKRQTRWGEAILSKEELHQVRREALFRTAARAFNELGFYNTTLDDLARRLNVTKPALYRYVKDKDDILFECNRLALRHMEDVLKEAEAGAGSGLEKFRHFLVRYTDLMTNDFGACLVRTGLRPLTSESQARLRPLAVKLNEALRSIIAQGVADGSIRQCDPHLAANAVFGGFSGIANWYHEGGALKPADIASGYLALYIDGLGGHDTPGRKIAR